MCFQEASVFSAKIWLDELAPARDHRDPHEPTRLSTNKMLETAPALKHCACAKKRSGL